MYSNLVYSEDLDIEKKINLFFDHFAFVTEHIGLIDDLPLENHLSLIDKIIFQIKYNFEHCVIYVDNYFANPLIREDSFIGEFDAYHQLEPLIGEYNKKKSRDKKNFLKGREFQEALKMMRCELSDNAFQRSLDIITEAVCVSESTSNSESTNNFVDDITYHIKLLISEFLFANRTRSEFLFTNRTREDILNMLARIIDPRSFPYPASITTKEEKQQYYAQLSLEDQLQTIDKFYKQEPSKAIFVCKIYQISSDADFNFTYQQVTFRSKEHGRANIKPSGDNNLPKQFIEMFFNEEEFVLAYLPIMYHNRFSFPKSQKAIDQVKRALSFMNHIIDTNGVVDISDYMLVDENYERIGGGRTSNEHKIEVNDLNKLKNNSAYEFLDGLENEAADHIRKHEPYLIDAMLSKRPADYWHYLETIIQNALPRDKKKEVKDYVSSILLLNHQSSQNNLLDLYIANLVKYHIHWEYLGLTREEWGELCENMLSTEHTLNKVKNPFLSEIADRYIARDNEEINYKKLKEYYCSILTEAYEGSPLSE